MKHLLSRSSAVLMVASAIVLSMPLLAFAQDESGSVSDGSLHGVSVDKADFYSEEETSPIAFFAVSSLEPIPVSDDMKYFTKYESGCNYDQGFSWGDGYHAMGCYQFDHRYGLQDFLTQCYEYDSATYGMFEQFISVNPSSFRNESAIRQNDEFTSLGHALNDAWHAAYAANPEEFSALQDAWAYQEYYLPAENYLMSIDIDISDRSDAVKGLCWGMSNLFGSTGWHKFVGGYSDGYDRNGVYHNLDENYYWSGCGLTNDMTDEEFVTTLCNYVVENVSVFYKGQPQNHKGWEDRYKNELVDCLEILERTNPSTPEPEVPVEPETPSTPDPVVPEPDVPSTPDPEVPVEPETPSVPEPEAPSDPETPSVDPDDVTSGTPETSAPNVEQNGDTKLNVSDDQVASSIDSDSAAMYTATAYHNQALPATNDSACMMFVAIAVMLSISAGVSIVAVCKLRKQ